MPHPRRIGERFDDHPTLKIAFNALTDVNESSALKRKSGKAEKRKSGKAEKRKKKFV